MNLSALLQLADSGFPSGAFAHSFGLETAIDAGRVHDAPTLALWLRSYLLESLAPLDGGAAALVFAGTDPLLIDGFLSAAIFAAEVRAATSAIARSTLATFCALELQNQRIVAYEQAIYDGRADGHAAIAAALGYEAAGVDCEDALRAFFSASLASLGAAASRAVPLGQRSVSAVLWALRVPIDEAVRVSRSIETPDGLHAQAFAQEIDALGHCRLNGRLFAS
ncbi:MAG TPA: urease accessory UreF family protein [Candidatus Baltobacteraceae bacterium]